jgi:hypothetical protein
MEYRSIKWWMRALLAQLRHYLRNILCRKVLRIKFEATGPDKLTAYIIKNADKLYKILIVKYPEFTWVRKYIDHSMAPVAIPLTMCGIHELTQWPVLWFNEGTIGDCIFFLRNGIPFASRIFINNGDPHSITIIGYNSESKEIIFHDPLGDYFSNYIIVYGAGIRMKYDKFIAINAGKPIFMSAMINPEILSKVKQNIEGRKYYIFE